MEGKGRRCGEGRAPQAEGWLKEECPNNYMGSIEETHLDIFV